MVMAPRLRALLAILFYGFTLISISILILTLLALDVFSVPYLTPFAHFLKLVIQPFVPFIAPLYTGVFIKMYKQAPFPNRKSWLCSTGCLIGQQLPRVSKNLGSLYTFGEDNWMRGLCKVDECTSSWLEAVLLVGVIVSEWRGWKWDGGYVQLWVEKAIEEFIKKEWEIYEAEQMERGVGDAEEVVEADKTDCDRKQT